MFRFVTLAIIFMIALAGVEAAKLQSKNLVKAKTQAKAFAAAYEQLQETLDEMAENGELDQSDFDWGSIGRGFNKGLSNLKKMFHF